MSGYLERFMDEDQGSVGFLKFSQERCIRFKHETPKDNCEKDMLVFSSRGTLT